MSGIWFGDVKTIGCYKAVINECRQLAPNRLGCRPKAETEMTHLRKKSVVASYGTLRQH